LGELLLAQGASQAAIDSLPDAVIIFDAKGGVLSSNESATRLLRVELQGGLQPFAQADPAVRDVLERMRTYVLTGKGAYQPKGLEEAVRVDTPEGPRYLLPRATPVHAEGELRGAAVVLQDVTRLQRFDELTNNLVATVAHELRTPLTSLRMAIHLCLELAAGPLTEKQSDLLFAAREDCERLQSMVDDLLDLSRLQAGREELSFSAVSSGSLVEEARDDHLGLATEKDLVLTAEDLTEGTPVQVDTERIKLVFANLVANAIRHSPRGGTVTLTARSEGRRVRFEVSDQGPGIPSEYRTRVFEKFFRAPGAVGPGAGLGLYIAREIVLAHKGEIGVTSLDGKGSTFWFTLAVA
jgi:signal transduction histidine kinase